jgi:hypothetical protein
LHRFDPENTGFVPSNTFLKRLGVIKESPTSGGSRGLDDMLDNSLNESFNSANINDENIPHIPKAKMSAQKFDNTYKVKPASRRSNKNPVDKWLKKRFRDGFSKMKTSFEELDLQKTGQVTIKSNNFIKIEICI